MTELARKPEEIKYAVGEEYPDHNIPVDVRRGVAATAMNGFRYWAFTEHGVADANPNSPVPDNNSGETLGRAYSRHLGNHYPNSHN